MTITTAKKLSFLHFAGDCWVNGRTVAVYSTPDGDVRRLVAETPSGTHAPFTRIVDVSREKYAELQAEWTKNGKLSPNDANVVVAALAFLS